MFNYWLRKSVNRIKHYAKAERLASDACGLKWDIVCCGSTQFLYALDFSGTPEISGESLAFEVQPFLYDFLLLKRFSSRIRQGGTVIFGVCPFSFLLYDFAPGARKKERFKRYGFMLDRKQLPGYSFLSRAGVRLNCFFWKKIYCLLNPGNALLPEKSCFDRKALTGNAISGDAAKRMNDWKKNFFCSSAEKSFPFDREKIRKNIDLLSAMIDFARKENFRPVIALAPVHSELYRLFDPEEMENCLYSPLKEVVQKNPQTEIYNYMTAPEFQKDEYFLDSLLLSGSGRKAFTAECVRRFLSGENQKC